MSPDQRFVAIMTVLGLLASALGWIGKSLLGVVKQWTVTGLKLEQLSLKLGEVVQWKDREHTRIDSRVDRLDQRVERHEVWHDDHPASH